MKEIIYRLRSQPERVKRRILHVLTAFFAVALFSIWIYSLGVNFSNPDTQAKINKSLEPFSALTANMVDGYYSITGSN